MFAASMPGKTRRLALPLSVLCGIRCARSLASSATSPCISPSTSSQGAISRSRPKVVRIFNALGRSLLPKFEWLSRAALGLTPQKI